MKYNNRIRKIEEKLNHIQIDVGYKIKMMGTRCVWFPISIKKRKIESIC